MRIFSSRRKTNGPRRGGAAAVEMAVVAPILLITAVGIIDVGQFIGVGQIVNNASREGARAAIRTDTALVSEVEAAVLAYMNDAISGVPSNTMSGALTVSVTDSVGTITGGDMTLVNSGDEVHVRVTFDYASIRWATSNFFNATTDLEATTTMRRE